MFVIAAILGPGEGAGFGGGGFDGRDGGLSGGGEAGKEKRDGLGVGVEGGAMMPAEFEFFAAHDKRVDEREIREKENRGGPRTHGDGGAEGENAAAEIEGIARVGIGAGGGEDGLLVEVASGVRANDETDEANASANQDGARDGTREAESEDGENVADADAPASEEVEESHAEAARMKK